MLMAWMHKAANRLVILPEVSISRNAAGFRHLQVHLSVPKRPLSQHILCNPADLRGSSDGDLAGIVVLVLSKETMSIDENPHVT